MLLLMLIERPPRYSRLQRVLQTCLLLLLTQQSEAARVKEATEGAEGVGGRGGGGRVVDEEERVEVVMCFDLEMGGKKKQRTLH